MKLQRRPIQNLHHRGFVISTFHHRAIDLFIIELSYFHHRGFVISYFHHRGFVVATFHHRTFVFSPSCYRLFIIFTIVVQLLKLFSIVLSTFRDRTIVFFYTIVVLSLRLFTFVISCFRCFYLCACRDGPNGTPQILHFFCAKASSRELYMSAKLIQSFQEFKIDMNKISLS